MELNPWHVESIEAFNFYCCPECVYRSKEEFYFQAHALQNHTQSRTFFSEVQKLENADEIEVKLEHTDGDDSNVKINTFVDNIEENGNFEETSYFDEGKFSVKINFFLR